MLVCICACSCVLSFVLVRFGLVSLISFHPHFVFKFCVVVFVLSALDIIMLEAVDSMLMNLRKHSKILQSSSPGVAPSLCSEQWGTLGLTGQCKFTHRYSRPRTNSIVKNGWQIIVYILFIFWSRSTMLTCSYAFATLSALQTSCVFQLLPVQKPWQ